MSGHSRWAQVKHKKAITDAKKGQAFSKMVREITIAAKTGGPSPDSNARLRSALERARTVGLPKDNIERAITKASGGDSETTLQEFLYEASAPGRVAILIEGITDNKNRTLAEVKHLLLEHGVKLAESGSLLWNFKKIGAVEITKEGPAEKSRDEMELAIIESGAEDFQELDNVWSIETGFSRLEEVRRALEERGFKVGGAYHDYKPGTRVDLPPEQKEKIEKLLEELTEHEDVQEVYTNLSG